MNIGKTGSCGENSAADFLKSKGYKIVARNYQTRYGELDIVCTDSRYIVFAEVKTRSANYMVSGREAVNIGKQNRIIKSAMIFLQQNECDLQPRFDVIEIIVNGGHEEIVHIENAFTADKYRGFC
jgi:putative endonuclease